MKNDRASSSNDLIRGIFKIGKRLSIEMGISVIYSSFWQSSETEIHAYCFAYSFTLL
jgi:hypothetical protein